jgi:hypothetical protein
VTDVRREASVAGKSAYKAERVDEYAAGPEHPFKSISSDR